MCWRRRNNRERCPRLDSAAASLHKGAMKRLSAAAALLVLLPIASLAGQPAPDPLGFVDPMIGTGPEGHYFPGGDRAAFGMVQLSPDTDATCQIAQMLRPCGGLQIS